MMKFLIVVSCVIAAASAGLIHNPWVQYQHIPVIGANGVPVEPAEVQIARAQHLAAHGHHTVVAAPVANGLPLDTPEVAAAKIQHAHDFAVAAQRNGAHAHHAHAYAHHVAPVVIGANGAPLETPEVQAAKAAHIAAHIEAKSRVASIVAPVSIHGANVVPLDTPEVALAKAQHLAAHAQAAHGAHAVPVVNQWW